MKQYTSGIPLTKGLKSRLFFSIDGILPISTEAKQAQPGESQLKLQLYHERLSPESMLPQSRMSHCWLQLRNISLVQSSHFDHSLPDPRQSTTLWWISSENKLGWGDDVRAPMERERAGKRKWYFSSFTMSSQWWFWVNMDDIQSISCEAGLAYPSAIQIKT